MGRGTGQESPLGTGLTLSELRDVLRKMFDEIDTDKSGSIDAEELGAVMTKLGMTVDDASIKRVMKEVDKDRSGTIEFDEFFDSFTSIHKVSELRRVIEEKILHALAAGVEPPLSWKGIPHQTGNVWMGIPEKASDNLTPEQEAEIRDEFMRFDLDKDNFISEKELCTILKHEKPFASPSEIDTVAKHMMELIDTDKNGFIDFKEFVTFLAVRKVPKLKNLYDDLFRNVTGSPCSHPKHKKKVNYDSDEESPYM